MENDNREYTAKEIQKKAQYSLDDRQGLSIESAFFDVKTEYLQKYVDDVSDVKHFILDHEVSSNANSANIQEWKQALYSALRLEEFAMSELYERMQYLDNYLVEKESRKANNIMSEKPKTVDEYLEESRVFIGKIERINEYDPEKAARLALEMLRNHTSLLKRMI